MATLTSVARTGWFRVASENCVYTDLTATTLATDGVAGELWLPMATAAGTNKFRWDGTSGTNANSPTYQAAHMNGKDALQFDGVQDYMVLYDAALAGAVTFDTLLSTTKGSFMMVMQVDSLPAAAKVVFGDTDIRLNLVLNTDGTMYVRTYDGATLYNGTAFSVPFQTPFVLAVTRTTGQTKVFVDDSNTPVVNEAQTDPNTLNRTLAVGGKTTGMAPVSISELAIFSEAITGTDLTESMQYLAEEWTISYTPGTNAKLIYVLPSITGLRRWVDYIPVQLSIPADLTDVNTYNDLGAIDTTAITDLTGKRAWVHYTPVYVTTDPASGRWRYDDNGWIPVTDI